MLLAAQNGVFTNCPTFSSFSDDGWKIRVFDFGEFSFTARNIENLVFQSAERGFKGRRTRLVAKCKPEKQRASELAKWVRDCHYLLVSLARPLSPHPTRMSFVLLSPRSPRHLLHSLFATDLKEGLCRSLSHLEVYLDLDLDHTIGMVHWVTRFRYPHRGPPFAPA